MHPSPIGEWAQRCWDAIPEHMPHVDVGEFVVMPNHVHGIVVIRDDGEYDRIAQYIAENSANWGRTGSPNGPTRILFLELPDECLLDPLVVIVLLPRPIGEGHPADGLLTDVPELEPEDQVLLLADGVQLGADAGM